MLLAAYIDRHPAILEKFRTILAKIDVETVSTQGHLIIVFELAMAWTIALPSYTVVVVVVVVVVFVVVFVVVIIAIVVISVFVDLIIGVFLQFMITCAKVYFHIIRSP